MAEQEDIKTAPTHRIAWKEIFSWKSLGRFLHSLLDGTFLTKGKFRRATPFIIFMMILGVIYITNIFRVERTKRQIDNLEEDLRELRYEYITSRSKLMNESKPSELVIKLKGTGIGETLDPPKKLVIDPKDKIN
jgi:hypothetical protein